MLSDNTVVCPARGHLSSDLDDEVVILDTENGVYYGLNPVAAFIWNRLTGPVSVGELVAAVLEEFEVDAETCRRDLGQLLSNLISAGLVEVRREAA